MDSSHHSSNLAGRIFATTSWSRIVSATDLDSDEMELALAELCAAYWYPLYAFVRRKGHAREEAEDITQAFYVELLEKHTLHAADSSRGRFRTFLLSALTNFIANWHRHRATEKRGAGRVPFSIDFAVAEEKLGHQPVDELTPQKVFERTWAMELLASAMKSVEEQYRATDKQAVFSVLQPCLNGTNVRSLKEIAADLEVSEGAAKVALHRLRQRFGDQLRLQIARTLQDPQQVDDELRALFAAIG